METNSVLPNSLCIGRGTVISGSEVKYSKAEVRVIASIVPHGRQWISQAPIWLLALKDSRNAPIWLRLIQPLLRKSHALPDVDAIAFTKLLRRSRMLGTFHGNNWLLVLRLG